MQSASVPGYSQPGSAEISGHAGRTQAFAACAKWPDTIMTDAAEGHQHRTHFSCQIAKKIKKLQPHSYFIILPS